MPRPRKPANPFRYFHSSPEVIRMAVMLYVRFPLSLRFRFIDMAPQTISAKVEYQFPPMAISQLGANLDYCYYYQGLTPTSTSDPRSKSEKYGLLDAHLTLSDIPIGGGKWRLSTFGRNLADKEYYIAQFNTGTSSAFFDQSRTYGLELSFEY